MSQDFITTFIEEAYASGACSIKELCTKAEEKIEENQKKLRDADLARVEIGQLTAFLKSHGISTKKKVREFTEIKEQAKFEDLEPKIAELTIKVCDFIETNHSIRPRDVMRTVGEFKMDFVIQDILKWLGINKIISKTEESFILKGTNWNNRPKIASE